MRGLKVVVTSGPTREYLDGVRFLSNASTGRMGIALARAAARRGAAVTLILGPSAIEPPAGVETVAVVSTQDMLRDTRSAAAKADVVIFAAAPSDWRPVRRRRGKPPREDGAWSLDLTSTPDIAATLGRRKGRRVHVGFALEVGGGEPRARAKLERKGLDAIVLNGLENMGTGGGRADWIVEGAEASPLPTASKSALARAILDRLESLLRARE